MAGRRTGTDARRQAWTDYWRQGALHSCVGSFDARYSGAIGAFWDAVVPAMAPGERVLDLATGNGALPLRIWEQHGDRVRVDAVDLAAVAPAWHAPARHASIAFHSGVAMEALPFPGAGHDWVVSQYGFEYAERGPAIAEVLRVLAPGGGLAFVMHHADSVLVDVGREEVAGIERVLAPGGLLEAARQALPWIARARRGDGDLAAHAQALHARQGYNDAMAALAAAIASSRVPDAMVEARQWVHALVSGPHSADAARATQALDGYRDALASAALRTSEMIAHALDEAQVRAMADRLRAAKPAATVEAAPLRQAEGIVGWGLSCR